MKQCIDEKGNVIKGLFKKDDGSLVVVDPEAYMRSMTQKANATKLQDEIESLKSQISNIMKLLNEKTNGNHI